MCRKMLKKNQSYMYILYINFKIILKTWHWKILLYFIITLKCNIVNQQKFNHSRLKYQNGISCLETVVQQTIYFCNN